MLAQSEEVTELGARGAAGFLQCLIKIEALDPPGLLVGLQIPQQVWDFVLAKAREREVDLGTGLKVGQQPCEELFVPGAADLVEGEVQETRLLDRDVEVGHRDCFEAEPSGGDEALVAADDGVVFPPREHGLDEAPLPDAAL
jgi:hypothetical protein